MMNNNFYRLYLSIFITTFWIGALFAQVEGKITLADDNQTYLVSIIPTADYSYPQNITNNAQLSFRAPAGSYIPANFTNITGFWSPSSVVTSPEEASEFEYFSFILAAPLDDVSYVMGEEIPLFSFVNANLDCQGGIIIIDNENDPFLPPNSQSINVGNYFSILGAGIGNAYAGTVNAEGASCPEALALEIDENTLTIPCSGETTDVIIQSIGGVAPFSVSCENTNTGFTETKQIDEIGGTVTFEALNSSTYNIIITDNLTQSVHEIVSIIEPMPIDLTLMSTNTSCDNSSDGVGEATLVTGGTIETDYSYIWSNGATEASVDNLTTGWHYLTVSDNNGCFTVDSIFIESNSDFVIETSVTNVSCYAGTDGSASVTTIGGNAPFTYTWGGENNNETVEHIDNLAAGTYYVTVLDATEVCAVFDSIIIEQPEEIVVSLETDVAFCSLVETGAITIMDVQHGESPFLYAIEQEDFSTENQFTVPVGNEYTIFVEDAMGCTSEASIYVPQAEPLQVVLHHEANIELGDVCTIDAIYSPSNVAVTFEWTIPNLDNCSDCSTMEFQPQETSIVEVIVRDSFGCMASASSKVQVKKERAIFIPTAFSPNNDGQNDVFMLYPGKSVAKIRQLAIYNRWGIQVFAQEEVSRDPSSAWNGQQKGQQLPTGIYIYQAEVEYIDGKKELLKGDVLLTR